MRAESSDRAGGKQRIRRVRAVERSDGLRPSGRATTGITKLWTAEGDPDFYDATTIFPDHVVARITAIAALASLIGREQGRNRCARSYLAGRGRRQPARRELRDRCRTNCGTAGR